MSPKKENLHLGVPAKMGIIISCPTAPAEINGIIPYPRRGQPVPPAGASAGLPQCQGNILCYYFLHSELIPSHRTHVNLQCYYSFNYKCLRKWDLPRKVACAALYENAHSELSITPTFHNDHFPSTALHQGWRSTKKSLELEANAHF